MNKAPFLRAISLRRVKYPGGGINMPPADKTGSTMTAAMLLQSPIQLARVSRQWRSQPELLPPVKQLMHSGLIGSRTLSGTLGSESRKVWEKRPEQLFVASEVP